MSVRLRLTTLVLAAVGFLLLLVGIFHGGWLIWVGFGVLEVAVLLSLWVKWGPNGWARELRRSRRG